MTYSFYTTNIIFVKCETYKIIEYIIKQIKVCKINILTFLSKSNVNYFKFQCASDICSPMYTKIKLASITIK